MGLVTRTVSLDFRWSEYFLPLIRHLHTLQKNVLGQNAQTSWSGLNISLASGKGPTRLMSGVITSRNGLLMAYTKASLRWQYDYSMCAQESLRTIRLTTMREMPIDSATVFCCSPAVTLSLICRTSAPVSLAE